MIFIDGLTGADFFVTTEGRDASEENSPTNEERQRQLASASSPTSSSASNTATHGRGPLASPVQFPDSPSTNFFAQFPQNIQQKKTLKRKLSTSTASDDVAAAANAASAFPSTSLDAMIRTSGRHNSGGGGPKNVGSQKPEKVN